MYLVYSCILISLFILNYFASIALGYFCDFSKFWVHLGYFGLAVSCACPVQCGLFLFHFHILGLILGFGNYCIVFSLYIFLFFSAIVSTCAGVRV